MRIRSYLCLIFLLPITVFAVGPSDQPVFVKEFIGQMEFIKGRLSQLAEAVPKDKFTWAPAEGVRNFGEVFVHTAEANFYLMSMIKNSGPDMNQDKSETDKKSALSMLSKSFSAVRDAASGLTEDDLNREVEAFGMKFSLRNFMITILNHCHEHLGQAIAYARMNGVTPPWSMKEQ